MSKRAIARERRQKALRESRSMLYVDGGSNDFVSMTGGSGGVGGQIVMNWSPVVDWASVAVPNDAGIVTLSSGTSAVTTRQANTIAIESLDEGVTWHVAETLEPATNVSGELRIGTNPCGRAPEFMRQGSGTYRFEIESRWATEEEVDAWVAQQPDRQSAWARTAEERAAAQAEVDRLAREAADARMRAERRALDLLRSHLNTEQRADFEARGGFWVRSQHGNRYWVTPFTAVRFDDHGVALQRYCIHTVDTDVPREDNALMRMLLLMCNEDEFLRTANPGPPSEWDLRRSQSLWPENLLTIPQGDQFVPSVTQGGELRIAAGNAGVGSTGNITITNAGWRVVQDLAVCRPALRYVNGVVRPLYG